MRVIHLLNRLMPSGMERMLKSAQRFWERHDIETHILAQGSQHPYKAELTAQGYDVREVRPIRTPGGMRDLHKAIKTIEPDVVNIHTEGAFLPAVLAIKSADSGVHIVRTIHSVFSPTGRALISRRAQALLADPFVSAFIAPSVPVREAEERFGRRAVHVIHNWVDDRFHRADLPPADPNGLIVGNCAWAKNHELALQACLENGLPFAHLGDESNASLEEQRLLDEAEHRGLLTGRGTRDPLHYMNAGTLFLLPSVNEGFSVALAEAITAGTAALVGPVSGLAWAKDLSGVHTVSLQLPEWSQAILKWIDRGLTGQTKGLSIDLSAARGVDEYADLYYMVRQRSDAAN